MNAYNHTQRAPLGYILGASAVGIAVVGALSNDHPGAVVVVIATAGLVFLAALCFGRMAVSDAGEHLAIRYGPLRVFRKRIRYADITKVERGRSKFIDGWGIHWIPWRGTTYNLWGFDCAVLRVKGKIVRVGSDDADNLVEFLRGKLDATVGPDTEESGAREALNPT